MKISIFAIALLLSCALIANAEEHQFTFFNMLKITNDYDSEEDMHSVRFQMELPFNLHLLETATTICSISDAAGEQQEEARGFAIQFLCATTECTSNTHLHAYLIGSTVTEEGEGIAKWHGPEHDASYTNRGVVEANDGMNPDTKFVMDAATYASLELPANGAETHYACHSKVDGTLYSTNLNAEFEIHDGAWIWEPVSVIPPST
jgi:hypothetical protein